MKQIKFSCCVFSLFFVPFLLVASVNMPSLNMLSLNIPAFNIFSVAQANDHTANGQTAAGQTVTAPAGLLNLQQEWARIKYKVVDEDKKINELQLLTEKFSKLTDANPANAEVKIWHSIILSTEADALGGLGADVKNDEAKALLEQVIDADPYGFNGIAFAYLGTLYARATGWPFGFGDDEEAEKHFKFALEINAKSIETNFLYGSFLLVEERYWDAKEYLEIAMKMPPLPDRALADTYMRRKIRILLAKVAKEL